MIILKDKCEKCGCSLLSTINKRSLRQDFVQTVNVGKTIRGRSVCNRCFNEIKMDNKLIQLVGMEFPDSLDFVLHKPDETYIYYLKNV